MAIGLMKFLKPAPNKDLEWLLDDEVILRRYIGQDAYLHSQIYGKLVQVFTVVFNGYEAGTYTFLPIDVTLEDYYQRLRRILLDLENKLGITSLRIVDFKAFPRLNGHFQSLISLWRFAKFMYYQDKERLLKIAPLGALTDYIRLMFMELDEWLNEHEVNKVKLLGNELNPHVVSYAGIQIDLEKANLKYQDSQWYTVQINQKEMQFLLMLVETKGKVNEYERIARSLDLNIAYQEADKMEVTRAVQFLKRNLGKRLKEAGLKAELVNQLLDSTISIHGSGYKLDNQR